MLVTADAEGTLTVQANLLMQLDATFWNWSPLLRTQTELIDATLSALARTDSNRPR